MPIDGGLRDKLEPGTMLVAKYKDAEHRAEVITDEEGKSRYRLEDGRTFKSPSAAASAIMGGAAANGWRFFSLEASTASPAKPAKARKPKAAAGEPEALETESIPEEIATE